MPDRAEVGRRNATMDCGFGSDYAGDSCFQILRGRIAADGLCRVNGTGDICWPLEYPITPPTRPANCQSTGTGTISTGWTTGHPPGVYCWDAPLTISFNGGSFVDYTFFAPKIIAGSASMTFVGRVINGRQTVFVAEAVDPIPASCQGLQGTSSAACALVLQGENNTINGDIFAPLGTIWISGGSFTTGGGEGFMEAEKILINGNLAAFLGSGPLLGNTPPFEEPGYWRYTPGGPLPAYWVYTDVPDQVVYDCCGLDE